MPLSREETAKRVKAARAYAGFEKQEDLGVLMQGDGHGITDPGLLERPNSKKKPPPLMGDRLRSISRHTGLPPEWFTEELPPTEPTGDADLRLLVAELEARVALLAKEMAERLDAPASKPSKTETPEQKD